MTIRPNKIYGLLACLMAVSGAIMEGLFLYLGTITPGGYGLAVIMLLYWVLLFQMAAAACKTVTLSPKGVSVRFLFLHKDCAWEEYAMRELRNYPGSQMQAPGEGVLFARRLRKIPGSWTPMGLCMVHGPLTSFYAAFSKENGMLPNSHMVEKERFLAAMGQWGVTLNSGRS